MKSKSVIFFSVCAALLITALILVLSFTAQPTVKNSAVSSDALAGENNAEVSPSANGKDIEGYYVDLSDGWYYDFTFSPSDQYDGTFKAGFDDEHTPSEANPQKDFTANGEWKVENGEIKLYSEGVYRSSMWYCNTHIVDSLNYFAGEISPDEPHQETVLLSKAKESGDTQIFNLYKDGKLIMEIIRNDGENDEDDKATDLPLYQMVAGRYEIENGEITIIIGQTGQKYHILDDGIAKWKYIRK